MLLGASLEDVILWKVIYLTNRKRLRRIKWVYLKNLELPHIKNIFNEGHTKNSNLLNYFKKRIND